MTGNRLKWVALAALLLVIAYAWIDGGEQALRPIAQPVDVPENAS